MTNSAYLDNSTSTRPSTAVVEAMQPYQRQIWAAPTAPHHAGQEQWDALQEAYKGLYDSLEATEADTLLLTSSTAEAVNHVLMGAYLDLTRETGQNHFITSVVDEAPALMGIGRLEQLGCVGKMIDVGPKGYVSAEDLREAITPRTAVVSLSWANALTGVVQPVEDLAQVCEDRGIFLHLDASHVMGRLVVDVGECAADFVSFSGDLMHGPKGIGGLWMKAGRHLSPFIVGGADQGGQRAGALPVPLVMGLAQAARESVDRIDHVCTETVRLRDRWETEVKRLMPEAQICFQGAERLPHVSCICFPGVSNEALLYYLNQRGVFASIGGGALQQIALLLTAKGFDEEMAQCAVSFSLSYETTDADIDYALSALDESLHQLRRLSKACWE